VCSGVAGYIDGRVDKLNWRWFQLLYQMEDEAREPGADLKNAKGEQIVAAPTLIKKLPRPYVV
jgi:hypothetical protein